MEEDIKLLKNKSYSLTERYKKIQSQNPDDLGIINDKIGNLISGTITKISTLVLYLEYNLKSEDELMQTINNMYYKIDVLHKDINLFKKLYYNKEHKDDVKKFLKDLYGKKSAEETFTELRIKFSHFYEN